ncbi:hypothetical protein FACS1894180_9560 [Bacteroidia bacterium]|nr:hypothetical protein FACS1894180_9560 [Bacteroidia bacterium]
MKKQFLLPHKCKFIGLGILVLGIILGIFKDFFGKFLTFGIPLQTPFDVHVENGAYNFSSETGRYFFGFDGDYSFTIQIFLIISGGLLAAFSKEKVEDEFTTSIRLKSLMYAVLANYILILIADVLVYGINFLTVTTYNLFTTLILFLIIFNVKMFLYSRKGAGNEK